MNSQRDTDWTLSARQNWWRRLNGEMLVVGKGRDADYWAMVDGDFLADHFQYLEQAQSAAERGAQ